MMMVWTIEETPVADILAEDKLLEIQAAQLSFLADPQSEDGRHAGHVVGDGLEDEQQRAADGERVCGDGGDLGELLADLDAVAVDAAGGEGGAVERADGRGGEDAG